MGEIRLGASGMRQFTKRSVSGMRRFSLPGTADPTRFHLSLEGGPADPRGFRLMGRNGNEQSGHTDGYLYSVHRVISSRQPAP